MKNQRVQFRLSAEEKAKLEEKIKNSGMNPSDYMRTVLLSDVPVRENGTAQQIVPHVCRCYTILDQVDAPAADQIMEELNAICRALQS